MGAFGIIYLVTCSINGKKYVGQTVQGTVRRWKRHVDTRAKKPGISGAIYKHGASNFTVCAIDSARDQDELNQKEIFWIRELKTLAPNGYNLSPGGDRWSPSQETRDRIRKALLGKPLSESHKKTLSVAHLGQKHSLETRRKMSVSHKLHNAINPRTTETQEKIASQLRGRNRTEQSRLKMSEGQREAGRRREVERQRTLDPILRLLFSEGKSLEEIGLVFGKSASTVKKRASKLGLRRQKASAAL